MSARWHVTGDVAREDLDAGGKFVSSREVSFEVLDTNTTGSVKIPLRLYTPEYVAGVIQSLADNMAIIGTLTSGQ